MPEADWPDHHLQDHDPQKYEKFLAASQNYKHRRDLKQLDLKNDPPNKHLLYAQHYADYDLYTHLIEPRFQKIISKALLHLINTPEEFFVKICLEGLKSKFDELGGNNMLTEILNVIQHLRTHVSLRSVLLKDYSEKDAEAQKKQTMEVGSKILNLCNEIDKINTKLAVSNMETSSKSCSKANGDHRSSDNSSQSQNSKNSSRFNDPNSFENLVICDKISELEKKIVYEILKNLHVMSYIFEQSALKNDLKSKEKSKRKSFWDQLTGLADAKVKLDENSGDGDTVAAKKLKLDLKMVDNINLVEAGIKGEGGSGGSGGKDGNLEQPRKDKLLPESKLDTSNIIHSNYMNPFQHDNLCLLPQQIQFYLDNWLRVLK